MASPQPEFWFGGPSITDNFLVSPVSGNNNLTCHSYKENPTNAVGGIRPIYEKEYSHVPSRLASWRSQVDITCFVTGEKPSDVTTEIGRIQNLCGTGKANLWWLEDVSDTGVTDEFISPAGLFSCDMASIATNEVPEIGDFAYFSGAGSNDEIVQLTNITTTPDTYTAVFQSTHLIGSLVIRVACVWHNAQLVNIRQSKAAPLGKTAIIVSFRVGSPAEVSGGTLPAP